METKKSKVFTKKLISLVLAVVMAVSGFFGVAFSAQAYQKGGYNDTNVKSNLLAWVDATDDQTLEALLDYLDDFLANMDWDNVNETTSQLDIESAIPSALKSFITLSVNIKNLPYVKVGAVTKGIASSVSIDVNIEGNVNSIDGIIDLMFTVKSSLASVASNAGSIANLAGFDLSTIGNLNFDVFGNYFHNSTGTGAGYKASSDGSYRTNNSAKYILKGLIKWLLNDNYENGTRSSLIHNLLYGSFELIPGKRDTIDIYGMLEGLLGMEDWEKDGNGLATYQTGNGIVYNFLKVLIMKNVPIYTDITSHMKEESSWVYDSELYKIANYYLQKLSFEITYPERVDFTGSGLTENGEAITGYRNDSSKRRYNLAVKAGKFNASTGMIDSAYAEANGWDANLVYSTENGYEGNVLVAKYNGMTTFALAASDTVHSAVMRALPIVWKTALKPTVQLLHVNYNGHDVHGTNFDNAFYYWVSDNIGWNRTDWTANYTAANMAAYTAAKYADYGFEDAASFEEYIKETLTYNETRMAKNEHYNWRDIDSSILFNEIRYSPLADQYFGIQTGPLNLYFEEIGCPNIINFFDNVFSASGTFLGQVDDALVAAIGDLFPTAKKATIGKTTLTDGEYGVTPMTLGALTTSSSTTDVADVVAALINDASIVFQYSADATDANILNPYYAFNGYQSITEDNLEEAIIPFAISALKHWSLTATIHDSDWDRVVDIESGAVVALNEYLGHVYPERDYEQYWTYEVNDAVVNGETVATRKSLVAKSGETLLDNVIVPMAGDALLFVVTAAGVPVYEQTQGASTVKTEGYNNSGSATILDPYTYTFFGKGVGLNNVLWQTINGVLCYFAVDKGIAGLVNLYSSANTCVVKKSNSVWTNLDNIINYLLPGLSKLLPRATSAGNGAVSNNVGTISSQKLIWTQLVNGVADVASSKFLTTALSYIGDVFVCAPIKTSTVFNAVVFDIAKPIINRVLGDRANPGTDTIITQSASTSNPADAFLKRDYLINTAIDNLIGSLYKLIYNSTTTYSSDFYTALTFGIGALHIIPKLNDNRIGGVSATLNDHAFTASSVQTKLAIRNESWGFASFYKDANGNRIQRGRSDATILGYQILNPNGTVNNTFTITGDGSFASTGALAAEAYTRVKLNGTASANGIYTVIVNYSMNARNTVSGGVTKTYSAKAVDYFYKGTTINEAWTEAYSGDNISSTAPATLITEAKVNNITYRTPNYVAAGSNAASAAYTWKVVNESSSDHTVANQYATVAANTPNYYAFDGDSDYAPSSAAATDAAYAAVNKNGEIIFADGTTADAAEYLYADDTVAMGYIKDADDNIVAVTVDTNSAADFKMGTPLAGVYLDTTAKKADAQKVEGEGDDQTKTPGEANVRFFADDSEAGLSAAYAPMVVNATSGRTFNVIVSSGNIDGAYGSLKGIASGLATHYATSDDTSAYNAIKADLMAALTNTIANGVNASNVAANLDVEETVENLEASAIENQSVEIDDLVYYVTEARKGRNNINYTSPALYEKAVDIAKEAEALLIAKARTEQVTDIEGNTTTQEVRDAKGDVIYDYYSYAPSIKVQEALRIYTEIYEPQAVLKTYSDSTTGRVAVEEVAHATSACDEFDDIIAASANAYTDFTATVVPDSAHQFAYSTADDNMKQYDLVDSYNVYASSADMTVKFGAIDAADNNKLINTTYTAESWAAYVDALGETIAAINNHVTQHELSDARCHLVMAENNLEEGAAAEGIKVSGTVFIAQNSTGTAGNFGARAVNFKVNGEYVLDENGNNAATSSEAGHYGEFEITVPEGTTEIVVTSANSIDRTVTLNGDAAVENADIKLIICDYNHDGKVTGTDTGLFKPNLNSSDYVPYDFNGDNKVTGTDTGLLKPLVNRPVNYAELDLD